MKNNYASQGVKWAAHIALYLCVYMLAASIIGVVAGFEFNTLTNDKFYHSSLLQRQFDSQMRSLLYTGFETVSDLAQEGQDGEKPAALTPQEHQALLQQIEYMEVSPNIAYVLTLEGRILHSNMPGVGERTDVETALSQMRALSEQSIFDETLYTERGAWQMRAVINTALPYQDEIYEQAQIFHQWLPYTRAALYAIVPVGLACALLLAFLCKTTGVQPEGEGVKLYWLDYIYSDIFTVIMAAALGVLLYIPMNLANYYQDLGQLALLAALFGLLLYIVAIQWLLSVVRRVRNKRLIRHSLIAAIFRGVRRFFRHIFRLLGHIFGSLPLTFLGVVGVLGLIVINLFLSAGAQYDGGMAMFYMLFCGAILLFVFYICSSFAIITRSAGNIADGKLDSKVSTRYLRGRLKKHADIINRIGEGLNHAVEEQMKSERFKTELVANVSHDIKTPLTSIINYVDLLQKTPQGGEQAQQYLEVLERNAQRLKVLTEDLVDLSKASTGNVQLQLEALNLNELVLQAVGEYSEKLSQNDLEVVTTLPEQPAMVHADGRHLWRVMENLFTNLSKYAMPNTRVYIDLQQQEQWVQLTVKNISAMALNIPAEALMERFVRGDAARNTSGSGLGLSIARSLVELQSGTFSLFVDGDLFKVVVRLPREKG